MIHGEDIAYDVVMAILSLSLFFICKKRPVEFEEPIPTKLCACPYSLMDMDAATDGFNPRRVIGQGWLGTVYIAVLPRGEVVGVKRIHPWLVLSNAGLGFLLMLKWLSLAHHPNLVPILRWRVAIGLGPTVEDCSRGG
ncbi:protein kinase superfamily protein [Actinidia rufa]|uniref:Protein kinase superfamily protein n=1 Tax=Actinidia rufa TaxID=165716 RepID=A0A7J0EZV6_9ERIC|nr:protein kinase superfamily protein [Actinidia rufa]